MPKITLSALLAFCLLCFVQVATADDSPSQGGLATASGNKVATLLEKGLGFLGVRYRMGGNGPDAGGFDCSGLVRKVFGEALGLNLPRTAAEMAHMGEKVASRDLKPGDLVFFNTMRRTFSHVGIYLGDNKFLHSPSSGSAVRVEDMNESYWHSRFTGGRRIISDAQAETPMPAARSYSPAESAVSSPQSTSGPGSSD